MHLLKYELQLVRMPSITESYRQSINYRLLNE